MAPASFAPADHDHHLHQDHRVGHRRPAARAGGHYRVAGVSDGVAIAALFVAVYGPGSHPATDAGWVSATIDSGSVWLLHETEAGVAGSVCSTPTGWAGVREIRALAVLGADHGRSVARSLLVEVRRVTIAAGCELACANLAHPFAVHLATTLGFHVVGHDGGEVVGPDGAACQLIGVGINGLAGVRRARLPRDNPFEPVVRYLPWSEGPREVLCPGPGQLVVAPRSEGVIEPHPEPGVVRLPALGGVTVRDGVAQVAHHLEGKGDTRLVVAVVPAHHAEFAACLARLGFRPSAYLPAWFEDGGVRHDCVRLVRSRGPVARVTPFERDIAAWNQTLARLLDPLR